MLDFRGLIATLESRGELCRIRKSVAPRFELAALMAQLDRQRQAFMFENVAGARFPLVGGLLNRWECYGWALGTVPGEPFGADELATRLETAQSSPLAPRTVAGGPVKEHILSGNSLGLGTLPVPTAFEFDSGAFITGACGISRNPQTGELNVGIYRTQVLGDHTLTVSANPSSDLHLFYEDAARRGVTIPIALAIGVEPALMMAAVCKLPTGESEIGLAGALQGKPIELIKCETSDLLVPANAEMIIEARVDCSNKVVNTLGEFVGQYGTDTSPVAQVTAITHRHNAMHYAILAGRNPEHNTLGKIAGFSFRRAVEKSLRQCLPGIRDLHVYLDPTLGAMTHVVIAISKRNDAEP
ncbi:MAG TPA: UbiD family decarboxylase, partial [Steroidobacteraceae bacterium]|nr:UbiD family decarboxylase [Steroidobacteraceae bacterium]